MVNTIVVSSVIAGIHETGVGSHRDIELLVVNDDNNVNIDPDCVMVQHPKLENLPPHLKNVVTYPKSRDPKSKRTADQLAYEVSGKKVGNVPAKLCGLFRQLKIERRVTRIYWYVKSSLWPFLIGPDHRTWLLGCYWLK